MGNKKDQSKLREWSFFVFTHYSPKTHAPPFVSSCCSIFDTSIMNPYLPNWQSFKRRQERKRETARDCDWLNIYHVYINWLVGCLINCSDAFVAEAANMSCLAVLFRLETWSIYASWNVYSAFLWIPPVPLVKCNKNVQAITFFALKHYITSFYYRITKQNQGNPKKHIVFYL